MQAVNTISHNAVTFAVKAKNRPFSNNFVQHKVAGTVRTRNGRDAVAVYVKCTDDSREPGRIYLCVYTLAGTLLQCESYN
jgi:hypothetical protein